jgi:hypothetical protein
MGLVWLAARAIVASSSPSADFIDHTVFYWFPIVCRRKLKLAGTALAPATNLELLQLFFLCGKLTDDDFVWALTSLLERRRDDTIRAVHRRHENDS